MPVGLNYCVRMDILRFTSNMGGNIIISYSVLNSCPRRGRRVIRMRQKYCNLRFQSHEPHVRSMRTKRIMTNLQPRTEYLPSES